jgi:hypothetical protein
MMTETTMQLEPDPTALAAARRWNGSRIAGMAMLAVAGVFFALHFLHLKADFPNDSPWMDWAKYTDEGWYGDAAIRHYFFGHWYWRGDFNPAVALPVWPALEWIVFRFTGVSVVAARAFTLCIFGVTLVALYALVRRHSPMRSGSLAAALAMLMLCCSPFLYVFERMAIIEPLLICLASLALLAASHLHRVTLPHGPWRFGELTKAVAPSLALGVLLPAMVLAKTTAICLLPAVGYMVWARAGYRWRPTLRLAVVPCLLTVTLWSAYYFGFVRPHYLEDYQYLFAANAYTGIELDPLAKVVLNTVFDGLWMGKALLPSFFAVVALALFWRPRLLANPLAPALGLWVAGYSAFLMYHNNLQPRYYTVIAVPITVLVAIGLDSFREAGSRRARVISGVAVAAILLAIIIPDAIEQIGFVRHPTYEFEAAAQGIRQIVLAEPAHSHLLLSISGSDITLMTGLPSIDDDFGTMDLDERARVYQPGWYAAWNEIEDDKMDALTPWFHVRRVASFAAMDDPERNLLILYRLDPATAPEPAKPVKPHKARVPRSLITKIGEQPSTDQLEH